MDDQTQKNINQLELLEQNSQHLTAQKQSFRSQLMEVESALEDISDDAETYRIVGNIMVKKNPSSLRDELSEKKQVLKVRIESLEKQQQSSKEKAKLLQDEIMKHLEKEKTKGD